MKYIVYETKGKTWNKTPQEHNEKKAEREERSKRTVWSKENISSELKRTKANILFEAANGNTQRKEWKQGQGEQIMDILGEDSGKGEKGKKDPQNTRQGGQITGIKWIDDGHS